MAAVPDAQAFGGRQTADFCVDIMGGSGADIMHSVPKHVE